MRRLRARGRTVVRCWIGACVACAVGVGAPGSVAGATLPDGRAYELVSAGTGADVLLDSGRTRAASGETSNLPMAAVFSSLAAFGDVGGTGIASDYLAQRTGEPGTSGWTVHGITPKQEPLSYFAAISGVDPLYEFFSPDLTRGVFRAWSPLTNAPNARQVSNLYSRDDVRAAGNGSYQLLSDAVGPQPPLRTGSDRPWIAGSSGDVRHVLYESRLNLTADAAGGNIKLYKTDAGIVRQIRANAACAGQNPFSGSFGAPCAIAGAAATATAGTALARYVRHAISDDGSRVNFTSPFGDPFSGMPNTQAGVVSKLFQVDDRGTLGTDDDAVVQVSMSEKASPDEAQAAIYETASTDGSRVFFRSSEQLTNTPGSGLYMWERQARNETQSLTVDATGGLFMLTAHTQPSQGVGTLTNGSTQVTDVSGGSFTVGQAITGVGIDPGTTITAVEISFFGQVTITLSAPATVDGPQSLSASIDATTGPLVWNATAAQVQATLEGLSIIGTGNVRVAGGPGGGAPFSIEFTGALGGVNMMQLTTDATGLSGGLPTATVTTDNDVRNLTLIGLGAGGVFGASGAGHRVYFAAGGDVTLWQDADGAPGGSLSHVATLPLSDIQGAEFPSLSVYWNSFTQPVSRVTPDGRFLLFETSDGSGLPPRYQHGTCSGNAVTGGAGSCAEAYVYRADSSTPGEPDIVCASCNFAVPGASGDTFDNVRTRTGASLTTSHLSRALTDDGRRVFFDTTEALDSADTNGFVDVYEYDVPSGHVHLISSGADPADSYLMDASANGDDVFFVSRARLVGWDIDQAYDVYDARVGGGFPEPAADVGCSGDACQGSTPAGPELAGLGSRAFRGLGDLKPRLHRRAAGKRCRRGRVKRRVRGKARCVKRRHRAARHARAVEWRAER